MTEQGGDLSTSVAAIGGAATYAWADRPLVFTTGPTFSYIPSASLPRKKARQVFVAYPYRLYPKADYRRVFKELEKAFKVTFVFADEKISNLHILEKIKNYITESEFGIYDISAWNANVTLELGLALGLEERAYITFDPAHTDVDEVPSDLRGIDRIQYGSYAELEEKLGVLLAQELPLPREHEAQNQLADLAEQVLKIATVDHGLRIGDIAKLLGVNTALAQVAVRPLVGHGLRTEGQKRGTKYFLDPTTITKP